jgi:hypothetical protein
MGSLRAKVYFKDTKESEWCAEKLLEFRDPLHELELVSEHVPIIEIEPKSIEYFEPLIVTISSCTEEGLVMVNYQVP